jgi:SAM-dependent methyltransferase
VRYRGLLTRLTRVPGTGLFAAGGWDRVLWMRGRHAGQTCPVCFDHGTHRVVLSVASTIVPDQLVTFVRCRRCDCKYVADFQPPSYHAVAVDEATLRFYVEQSAGLELFARAVFAASRRPVRNYLDVGCGFGFGLDMATRIFGWNAVGLDPGPLAAAGRDILGVRIERDVLAIGKSLPDGPYDAIVAMEVIEHVANPHDLLRAMGDNLTENGTLILSTPDGRYVDDHPEGEMLLPILSPGSHAVLYTMEALSGLLKKAGFQDVAIIQLGATLFAVASRGSTTNGITEINPSEYAGYLRSRYRDSLAGSAVHVGMGGRLLTFLVNGQEYGEALDVFSGLRDAIAERLNTDLARPLDIAERVLEERIGFADIPGKYPFCLAGLLFQRGLIAVRHERRSDLACCYFLAARFVARAFLKSLNQIGMSDGELALLSTLSTDALKSLL